MSMRPLRRPIGVLEQACRSSWTRSSRRVHIAATPSSTNGTESNINIPDPSSSEVSPDAQFEILGSPFSLLSASITASQPLYTRRGTLVGFTGKPENAVSTLSILEPFRRAVAGIPFLYQKISSTTPFTALISTKSPITAFTVVHLDGRTDWMVTARNALLAWTGHTLELQPQINTSMSIAHWGNTKATGRGLLCLAGKGQIYQIRVRTGEEYVVHPSNVVAYSIMRNAPEPYRFKSSTLRFQIPSVTSWIPDTRFTRTVRESQAWRFMVALGFTVRTWTRRSIWGDRLFLRFQGPANILLQARGNSITESLTNRDVNEIADAPAGAVVNAKAISEKAAVPEPASTAPAAAAAIAPPTKVGYASVGTQGKVEFNKE